MFLQKQEQAKKEQQLQQEIKETATKTQANFQRKADALTQDLDFDDLHTKNNEVMKGDAVELPQETMLKETTTKVAKKTVKKTSA